MQQKVLSAVIGLTYIEFLMEHHLSKLTTSSLVSDYADIPTTADTVYSTLNGQSHLVSSGVTFRDTLINDIIITKFYGVPIDVIRSLIREHLPEYVL